MSFISFNYNKYKKIVPLNSSVVNLGEQNIGRCRFVTDEILKTDNNKLISRTGEVLCDDIYELEYKDADISVGTLKKVLSKLDSDIDEMYIYKNNILIQDSSLDYHLYDELGNEITTEIIKDLININYHNGIIEIKKDDKYTFLDFSGKIIFKDSSDINFCEKLSSNTTKFKKRNKIYLKNLDNDNISKKYDSIFSENSQYLFFTLKLRSSHRRYYGVINKQGVEILPPKFKTSQLYLDGKDIYCAKNNMLYKYDYLKKDFSLLSDSQEITIDEFNKLIIYAEDDSILKKRIPLEKNDTIQKAITLFSTQISNESINSVMAKGDTIMINDFVIDKSLVENYENCNIPLVKVYYCLDFNIGEEKFCKTFDSEDKREQYLKHLEKLLDKTENKFHNDMKELSLNNQKVKKKI